MKKKPVKNRTTADASKAPQVQAAALLMELRELITTTRSGLTQAVNAGLTLLQAC